MGTPTGTCCSWSDLSNPQECAKGVGQSTWAAVPAQEAMVALPPSCAHSRFSRAAWASAPALEHSTLQRTLPSRAVSISHPISAFILHSEPPLAGSQDLLSHSPAHLLQQPLSCLGSCEHAKQNRTALLSQGPVPWPTECRGSSASERINNCSLRLSQACCATQQWDCTTRDLKIIN